MLIEPNLVQFSATANVLGYKIIIEESNGDLLFSHNRLHGIWNEVGRYPAKPSLSLSLSPIKTAYLFFYQSPRLPLDHHIAFSRIKTIYLFFHLSLSFFLPFPVMNAAVSPQSDVLIVPIDKDILIGTIYVVIYKPTVPLSVRVCWQQCDSLHGKNT